MFHWICPECGREIPPTVKECAVCDPAAAAPVTSVAAAPEPVAAAPVEPPPIETPAALAPPALPVATPPLKAEPEPEPVLDPMLALADQIRAAQAGTLEPTPSETQGLPQLAAAVGLMEV